MKYIKYTEIMVFQVREQTHYLKVKIRLFKYIFYN